MTPYARSLLFLAAFGFAQPAAAEIWVMATKANNIHCTLGDDPGETVMFCYIDRIRGAPQPDKPADCTATWGQHFRLSDHGPAKVLCLKGGRNDWPGNRKFTPGEVTDLGGVTCSATRNKLDCRNLDGRGFFLSYREQRVF